MQDAVFRGCKDQKIDTSGKKFLIKLRVDLEHIDIWTVTLLQKLPIRTSIIDFFKNEISKLHLTYIT